MKGSGKTDCVMEEENMYGQINLTMMENGLKIKLMEKESSLTLMAMFMMVIGKKIWPTVKEFTFTVEAPAMKEIGKMIFSMVWELRLGLMGQSTTVNMKLARNMAKAF